MSNTLNAHDCANLIPFNSEGFITPSAAAAFPLCSLLKAITSNDPHAITRAIDDYELAMVQVSDALDVAAEALTLREASPNKPSAQAGLYADGNKIAAALNMASSVVAFLAGAAPILVEAARRTGSTR